MSKLFKNNIDFEFDSPSKPITVKTNGVFGELLQGVGSDNRSFLITSPVNIFSTAHFVFERELQSIQIKDVCKFKSQTLANRIYEKYQLKIGGVVSVDTQFPIGKGLGSSSADLVAVAKILSSAYSLNLMPQDMEDLIRGIEPTDGVMYPGIVSYFYKEVKINKPLGKIRGAIILGVDEGGEIDTIEYNQHKHIYSQKEKKIYDQLHTDIEKAILANDIHEIGRISTYSGHLNQRFNIKKLFDEFVKIAESLSLPGIVIAHSGTYLGFLLDNTSHNFREKIDQLEEIISSLGYQSEFFTCNDRYLFE